MNGEVYFRTKTIKSPVLQKDITIILQKHNGPCMLIAIFNLLVLKGRVSICPGRYSSSQIIDLIIGVCPELAELSDNLLSLVNGCNVNPIFSSCNEFRGYPEFLKILNIKMYHGMLPDPATPIYDIVQNYDYEQLEMKIFELESNLRLINSQNVSGGFNENSGSIQDSEHKRESNIQLKEHDRLLLEQLKYFYNMIQRQVTNFGISVIDSAMQNGDVVIFFRSSHFSVLTKYMNRVFTLITDECFIKTNYVWETLPNENGESKYFDEDFILSSLTENQKTSKPSQQKTTNTQKPVPKHPNNTSQTPSNQSTLNNPLQNTTLPPTNSRNTANESTQKKHKKKKHRNKDQDCNIA